MIIPYQLERLLWYGLLVCLDSFLVSLQPGFTYEDGGCPLQQYETQASTKQAGSNTIYAALD